MLSLLSISFSLSLFLVVLVMEVRFLRLLRRSAISGFVSSGLSISRAGPTLSVALSPSKKKVSFSDLSFLATLMFLWVFAMLIPAAAIALSGSNSCALMA